MCVLFGFLHVRLHPAKLPHQRSGDEHVCCGCRCHPCPTRFHWAVRMGMAMDSEGGPDERYLDAAGRPITDV